MVAPARKLAIDPGADCAGALLETNMPPLVFLIHKPTSGAVWRMMRHCTRDGPVELVVEDQMLQRGEHANVQSLLSLARAAEKWIVVAELLGMSWIRVHPSTWREPMIASVPEEGDNDSKKKRTKRLAARLWPEVEVCRGELGRDVVKIQKTIRLANHVTDAMIMARWRSLE